MRRERLASMMKLSVCALAAACLLTAAPACAEEEPVKPDVDLYALMTGKCSRLTVAGRDFG